MAERLLIADVAVAELWEIDPDGADTEGTLLRDLPTTLTSPTGNDGAWRKAANSRHHRQPHSMGD